MTDQRASHLPVVPMSAQQQQERHQQQAAAIERAKLRARKPTDKTMPEGVEDCVLSDGVHRYREMREFERRLDAIITRKRLDVMDSVGRNVKRFKTLRIWISNTVEDQVWQSGGLDAASFDFSTNNDSTYRVTIQGQLLDDEEEPEKDDDDDDDDREVAENGDKMDTDAPAEDKGKQTEESKKQTPQANFSHFFKAITVDFDGSKMRNGAEQSVEWKKPTNVNDPGAVFDQFNFKRNGDENTNITFNLFRDETPERFQLSPALADVVDETVATRAEAVMGVWEYIKLMDLQEDEEKRQFRCDELLKKV